LRLVASVEQVPSRAKEDATQKVLTVRGWRHTAQAADRASLAAPPALWCTMTVLAAAVLAMTLVPAGLATQ
jgi:hypothetical protein